MLSPSTIRMYSILFIIATTFKCAPFQWSPSNQRLAPGKKRTSFMFYLISFIELIFVVLVLVGYSYHYTNQKSIGKDILPILYCIGLALGLFSILGLHLFQDDVISLTNKLFQFNTNIRQELQLTKCYDQMLQLIFKCFFLLTNLITLGLFISLLRPGGTANLYIIYGGTYWIGRLGFALMSSWILSNLWIRISIFLFLLYGTGFVLQDFPKLVIGRIQCGQMSSGQGFRMCRSIQIIFILIQGCFGPLMLPSYLFNTIFLAITCSSTLILFHSQLTIFPQIVLIDLTFVTCYGIYLGFDLACSLLQSMDNLLALLRKEFSDNQVKQLQLKACRPIRLQFGSFFKIKEKTALTVFGIILDNVCSLVIMYQ